MAAPDRQLSRVERAARVRELLASGMTTREIAADWGVRTRAIRELRNDPTGEKQRARRERYREPCSSCGRPLDGSNGFKPAEGRTGLCAKCVRDVVWTRGKIIAALWLFACKYGRQPTVLDANPALARQAYRRRDSGIGKERLLAQAEAFRRDGILPSSDTVVQRFGTWTDGLIAAGFDRNPRGGHPSKRNARPEREVSSGRTLLRDCGNPDDDRTPSVGLPSESPD